MKLRSTLRALVVASLAGSLLAAPAMAATPRTTATITVTDDLGHRVAGITVVAINEDAIDDDDDSFAGIVSFGDTNANGTIELSRGNAPLNQLTGGVWTFYASDADEDRAAHATSFASTEKDVDLTAGQDNAVSIDVPPGNAIVGTVTAPSGKPVKNLYLEAASTNGDDPGFGSAFIVPPSTSAKGAFALGGLDRGTYRVIAYQDDEESAPALTGVKETFTGHGVTRTADIRNFKVRCTRGFSLSSPTKGQTRMSIRSTAPRLGISKPGGKVKVYRGSKLVKTIPWKDASKTFTLTGQPRGKKVSYKVAYSGGDCTSWTSTKTLKVKK